MTGTWLFEIIDSLLIAPYRWPQDPVTGWWLGTFVLGLWCVVLGQITLSLLHLANRTFLSDASRETVEYHESSMNALREGDRSAYRAINRLANEAFGRTFFLEAAMACGALWPAACALGWMQTRFSEVAFPLPLVIPHVGGTVGFSFIFILVYILMRIVLGRIRSHVLKKGLFTFDF